MNRTRLPRARDVLVAAAALGFAFAAQAQDTGKLDGKAVFTKWCAPCHGDGPGKPGTAALQALYKGAKPALLEQRTDLPPELTKQFVRTGVSVMPFFRKTEISDVELEALAGYLAHR
ncbi:MAG TPA: cytochrome c [Gammaproteobacteria bacterium]|nr:cytochrome c [Gammaproteobacteria bacterium]